MRNTEEFTDREPHTRFEKVVDKVREVLEKPVEYVRNTWVLPYQTSYPWYHEKFRRVPTIDECTQNDPVCFSEANYQFKRDRNVDSEILRILRQRFEDCVLFETPHHMEKCTHVLQDYKDAEENWFIKYGDLGGYANVLKCYMKQKHRLIWERRNGEVGEGIKEETNDTENLKK